MVADWIALHEPNTTYKCKIRLLINFIPDQLLVTQSLIGDARGEKFVEIKPMFDQKLDVACLELQDWISKDFRVLKDEEVEGSNCVGMCLWVPLEGDDSELKGVHPCAVVLQLLVAVFNLVKTVNLVFVTDVQAWKFSVDTDEISCFDGINNKG